jgi:hypothetical protein
MLPRLLTNGTKRLTAESETTRFHIPGAPENANACSAGVIVQSRLTILCSAC